MRCLISCEHEHEHPLKYGTNEFGEHFAERQSIQNHFRGVAVIEANGSSKGCTEGIISNVKGSVRVLF